MKSVGMRTRPQVRIRILLLALGLWAAVPGAAGAEPPPECRDLAAGFANPAVSLDLGALAALMSCVSTEIAGRTGGTAPVPPPPPPEVAPPPAPSPPPPPPPPPSSFREAWPASAPWGSPWPNIGPDVR
jgi:hypothetical protein